MHPINLMREVVQHKGLQDGEKVLIQAGDPSEQRMTLQVAFALRLLSGKCIKDRAVEIVTGTSRVSFFLPKHDRNI